MLATVKTLTKGELCRIFGLYSQTSGRCYYTRLRQRFFTDEALKKLGLTREDYKVRTFSFDQTQAIIKHFKIQRDEILDAVIL